jgi:hypothetical protein
MQQQPIIVSSQPPISSQQTQKFVQQPQQQPQTAPISNQGPPQQPKQRPADFPQQQPPRSQYQQPPGASQQQPPVVTQQQYMQQSGTASAVNSIPPSRDPKQGGHVMGAGVVQQQVGTPTQPPVGMPPLPSGQPLVSMLQLQQLQQHPTHHYMNSANRDSQPIASEELVERLEEISTQQGSPDATEDPER